MDMVFLELDASLGAYPYVAVGQLPVSTWLAAVIVEGLGGDVGLPGHDETRLRLVVVTQPSQKYPVTPWMSSLDEVAVARRQLLRLLADAQPTQVVRWNGSEFICEDS